MDQPDSQPTHHGLPEERLGSWKEIAAYLGRDVTTVQRWERREDMPVRRHVHDKGSSVYALRSELDAWSRGRSGADRRVSPEPSSVAVIATAPTTLLSRRTLGVLAAVVGVGLLVAGGAWLVTSKGSSWSNPLQGATLTLVSGSDGTEQAAALSPDGTLLAFLSDRDGQTDIWITHLGTGQFYNLTRGAITQLANPSVRTLGFSPDGGLVTFWRREPSTDDDGDISIWAVPVLGGRPRPYLENAAEFDWSRDGRQLVYHTPAPGDPMYLREGSASRVLLAAPAGLHAHFPVWGPGDSFVYFVRGAASGPRDLWRVEPGTGEAERVTRHDSYVSHPVVLDDRSMVYLADPDGSGPRLHGLDVRSGASHQLSQGLDRYTSLTASRDGRRVAATVTRTRETLWRMALASARAPVEAVEAVPLTTSQGSSPRAGPGYLLYVAPVAGSDALWKISAGQTGQLWTTAGARMIGAPAISPNGQQVAFSVDVAGKTVLMVMNADGRHARAVTTALSLEGPPSWSPDSRSIVVSAGDQGLPKVFRVPLDGQRPVRLSAGYAMAPAWVPDGSAVVYLGPDVGATSTVSAIAGDGRTAPLPPLKLTRGAGSLRFIGSGRQMVVLRGSLQHKDLWVIDLNTGAERQLTRLPSDFQVRDFDISPDGRDVFFARVEERSEIILMDRGRR